MAHVDTRPTPRYLSAVLPSVNETLAMEHASNLLSLDQLYWVHKTATVLGTLIILKFVLSFLWDLHNGVCAYVLAPLGIHRTNLKKYGSWAVVTGASEGIGRGYALELARQGLNVVIMSRSQEKLGKVADEIKQTYGREVRVIAVDFTGGQEIYQRIADQLAGLDIGVLVNNVSLIHENPGVFCHFSELDLRRLVEVNCQAFVQMTHLVLPKMAEKYRGVIVNVTSGLVNSRLRVPFQYLSVYSASKFFMEYFSDAMRKEYQYKGILVQTVTPFFIAAGMSGIDQANVVAPGPVTYTRHAVATIGIQNTTYGYFLHAIQGWVFSWLPHWLILLLLYVMATALGRKSKNVNF